MSKVKTSTRVVYVFLVLLMVFGAFSALIPTVNAVGPVGQVIDQNQKGALTVYKASEQASTQAQIITAYNEAKKANVSVFANVEKEWLNANYYVKTENGATTYHAYLSGAEYSVYYIADIVQDTTTNETKYVLTEAAKTALGSSYASVNTITEAKYAEILKDLKSANLSSLESLKSNTTGTDGKASISNLKVGVYFAKETQTPVNVVKSNDFIVSIPITETKDGVTQWNYNVVAYPKNDDIPYLKKSVEARKPGTDILYNNVNNELTSYGGTNLTYTIEVKIKEDLKQNTDLKITDISSVNLKINRPTNGISQKYSVNDLELWVYCNGAQLLVENNIAPFTYDYREDANQNTFSTSFTSQIPTFKKGDVITIKYNAKINTDTTQTISNGVMCDIDGKKVYDEVKINIGGVGIRKVKDDGKSMLEGAKFALGYWAHTNSNGTETIVSDAKADKANDKYYYVKAIYAVGSTTDVVQYTRTENINEAYIVESKTNSDFYSDQTKAGTAKNALAIFKSMGYGTYYLTEKEAPAGYVLMPSALEIEVSPNSTKEITVDNVNGNVHYYGAGYSYTVTNALSTVLPGTGGDGIYLFLIVGAALICTATIILIKNRKKRDSQ